MVATCIQPVVNENIIHFLGFWEEMSRAIGVSLGPISFIDMIITLV